MAAAIVVQETNIAVRNKIEFRSRAILRSKIVTLEQN